MEEQRIHHKLWGERLGLFLFMEDEIGSGLPMWLPTGRMLRERLIGFLRGLNDQREYSEIVSPHIAVADLYDRSGHLSMYRDKIYMLDSGDVLKPMNCPLHIEAIRHFLKCGQQHPIRVSEFAQVFRKEQRGELNGLLRARSFMQDDGHVLLAVNQLYDELLDMLEMVKTTMAHLNLSYYYRIGLRDGGEKYLGDLHVWHQAEEILQQACVRAGIEFKLMAGDAAFYGPKLDIVVKDRLDRDWQMGTIQIDFQLAPIFGLGESVIVHRAIVGSIERCLGVLLEVNDGWLPMSLAPVQVRVLPVSDQYLPFAEEVASLIGDMRVEVDRKSDPVTKKVSRASADRVPMQLVVGKREQASQTFQVRLFDDIHQGVSLEKLPSVCAHT